MVVMMIFHSNISVGGDDPIAHESVFLIVYLFLSLRFFLLCCVFGKQQ